MFSGISAPSRIYKANRDTAITIFKAAKTMAVRSAPSTVWQCHHYCLLQSSLNHLWLAPLAFTWHGRWIGTAWIASEYITGNHSQGTSQSHSHLWVWMDLSWGQRKATSPGPKVDWPATKPTDEASRHSSIRQEYIYSLHSLACMLAQSELTSSPCICSSRVQLMKDSNVFCASR